MPPVAWRAPASVAEAEAAGLMMPGELDGVTDAELVESEELNVIMKRRFKRRLKEAIQRNRDMHSLRCDFRLKMSVADMFLNDHFYFPFNMDFRGRACVAGWWPRCAGSCVLGCVSLLCPKAGRHFV